MGKKNKKRGEALAAALPEEPGLSARGKRVIAAGIAALVLGFLVLTRTDPRGRNWASVLSPFLILGGYAIVALGIMLPEPGQPWPFAEPDTSEPPPRQPPAA